MSRTWDDENLCRRPLDGHHVPRSGFFGFVQERGPEFEGLAALGQVSVADRDLPMGAAEKLRQGIDGAALHTHPGRKNASFTR